VTLDIDACRLDGYTAVVTGAAQGIGLASALALRRFGALVAVCDRDGEALGRAVGELGALGNEAPSACIDVRDADQLDAFLADVLGAFTVVDVLVNNAGGGFRSPFVDVSDKGMDALVRENFTQVARCIRGVAPSMRAEAASIVNMTSIEAHRAGPGFAVYSAMKAGLESLTKSLALELGPRNIRVNCIAPDVIPTPGVGELAVNTPLPRQGDVDDVAAAVVFLANARLSGFVTGSTIHVDGGNFAAGGWHRLADGSYAT
jgi:NAD(P)-dependent dehydrogenase (short-subunit alcohol dehydrogenase family)